MEAEQLSETKNVVSRFVKLSGSKLAVYRARQWGVSSVAGGFTDSIQDIGYSGLYKDGPIDRSKLSKDLLKDSEKWSVIL